MNLQPTGDPVILENAVISLEAVRTELERAGQSVAARTLSGLEVHNSAGAQVAIDALSSINSTHYGVQVAIAAAISACQLAVRPVVAAA